MPLPPTYKFRSIPALIGLYTKFGTDPGYLHIVLSNLPSMDFRQHPELLKDLMPWSDYMRSCFEQE